MKKNLLFLFLFLTQFLLAQETYTMKSGGRIFNASGERLNSSKVAESFSQEALTLYKAGRTKKTVGNVFFWGGLSVLGGKFIHDTTVPFYHGPTSTVLYYVGAGVVLVSIPIKLGFQNKIRKSVEVMNEFTAKSDKAAIESTDLIVNANGVGVSITF